MRQSVAFGIGPLFAFALSLNILVPGLGEFAAGRMISAGMPSAQQRGATKKNAGPIAKAARRVEQNSAQLSH